MENSTDTFKNESWIALLYPLATKDGDEPDPDPDQGPKISPIIIFFLFLVLDAFIIAAFYFCYFMRTKSLKPRTDQVQDKPPPYQIAVMENVYPPVSAKVSDDDSSSIGELPSYDDTVIKNTNLHLPQPQPASTASGDIQIDMTVKMT